MKVAVGSTNPVKIQAVEEVFKEVFRKEVEIMSVKVNPRVPTQPFKEDIIKGSVNRAKKALKLTDADLGAGIESGVMKFGEKWYNLGFITIVDRKGTVGTGTSGWFECPSTILKELENGKELGQVISEITGIVDVERREGAIGVFTKGKVTRKELYEHGIFIALAKFLSPEIFEMKNSKHS
ncbi:MAG: inosine/xanthosine triphosphatase [Thermoproteota archaeon]|nr:inosine/xanthosine triphosphatase [Thermoproteota archaeon]